MSKTVELKLALTGAGQVIGGLGRVEDGLARVGGRAEDSVAGTDRLAQAVGRVAHYGLAGGGIYALAQTVAAAGRGQYHDCKPEEL